jgi:hypothetical protein
MDYRIENVITIIVIVDSKLHKNPNVYGFYVFVHLSTNQLLFKIFHFAHLRVGGLLSMNICSYLTGFHWNETSSIWNADFVWYRCPKSNGL